MTMHLLENAVLPIRAGTEGFKTVEPERMLFAVRNIYAGRLPGPREEVCDRIAIGQTWGHTWGHGNVVP